MQCANKTSSVLAAPAPTSVDRNRPAFTLAIVAIVGALQEALELRRTAHRSHPLTDE
jgi:hypothetical protein